MVKWFNEQGQFLLMVGLALLWGWFLSSNVEIHHVSYDKAGSRQEAKAVLPHR